MTPTGKTPLKAATTKGGHAILGVIPAGTVLNIAGLEYYADTGGRSVRDRFVYGENDQTPGGGLKCVQIGNDFWTTTKLITEWITENAVVQQRPRKKGGSRKRIDGEIDAEADLEK